MPPVRGITMRHRVLAGYGSMQTMCVVADSLYAPPAPNRRRLDPVADVLRQLVSVLHEVSVGS